MYQRKEVENQINQWTLKNLGNSFSFRENQFEQIVNIVYNIVNNNDDKKTQIIEAPTGSGKSIIILVSAGVLADYYNLPSYVLCSDLFLFSQYEDFIREHKLDIGCCKGITGNYVCKPHKCMVSDAPCKMSGIPYRGLKVFGGDYFECSTKCQYMMARKKASQTKVSVLTYSLFMYQMNICDGGTKTEPDGYQPAAFIFRPIIFCDECHKIPNIVQLFISPYVCPSNDFPIYHEILSYVFKKSKKFNEEEYFNQLREKYDLMRNETNPWEIYYHYKGYVGLLNTVKTCTEIISRIFKDKENKDEELTQYERFVFGKSNHFKNLMCYMNDFIDAIEQTSPLYLVKKNDKQGITFNCVLESVLIQNYLFKWSDFQVLTSATVGDQDIFNDNCGIEESDFTKMSSNFDFTESPITYVSGSKMSQNKLKGSIDAQVKRLMMILDKHKFEKGIIHTGSYNLSNKIYKLLPKEYQQRLLVYKTSSQKESIINDFKKSQDKVLIGPSLVEGVDLPDDMCRFNILLKVPFPSMGDPYVKRKMMLYKKWYNFHTSNCVIQALGRGIRHKKDYCQCYILDGCFTRLMKLTKKQYPKEFTDRIIEIKGETFDRLFENNIENFAEVA